MSMTNDREPPTNVMEVDGRWVRVTDEPSVTRQEHKEEAEINTIVERFDRTGQLTHVSRLTGQYLDVSDIGSFEQAIAMSRHGEEIFSQLPASLRAQFDHNAGAFMDYMAQATPEQIKELGLITSPNPSQAPNQPLASDAPPVESEGSTEPPAAS